MVDEIQRPFTMVARSFVSNIKMVSSVSHMSRLVPVSLSKTNYRFFHLKQYIC